MRQYARHTSCAQQSAAPLPTGGTAPSFSNRKNQGLTEDLFRLEPKPPSLIFRGATFLGLGFLVSGTLGLPLGFLRALGPKTRTQPNEYHKANDGKMDSSPKLAQPSFLLNPRLTPACCPTWGNTAFLAVTSSPPRLLTKCHCTFALLGLGLADRHLHRGRGRGNFSSCHHALHHSHCCCRCSRHGRSRAALEGVVGTEFPPLRPQDHHHLGDSNLGVFSSNQGSGREMDKSKVIYKGKREKQILEGISFLSTPRSSRLT